MRTLIKSRFILLFAALSALLFVGACTLEDGEPFGYATFELSVQEPNLGPDFALNSFEIEVESLHLWADADAPEEKDDHGHSHSHDHGPEEPASPDDEDLEIVHIEVDAHFISTDVLSLGDVAITNNAPVDNVELEVHALSVQGTLTRDGQQIPTRLILEHAHLMVSGPADVSFTINDPERQHLSVELQWPDEWLEDVDIEQLEVGSNGEIRIDGDSNAAAAAEIAAHLHDATLTMEVR